MTSRTCRRHGRALLVSVALAYLVVMLLTGERPGQGQFVPFEAAGVLSADPARVTHIDIDAGTRHWRLARTAQGWQRDDVVLAAGAAAALELGLKALYASRPVRELRGATIDAHAHEYGLDRPALALRLRSARDIDLGLAFGGPSADGALRYLRVEGVPGVSLVSPFVAEQWEAVVGELAQ